MAQELKWGRQLMLQKVNLSPQTLRLGLVSWAKIDVEHGTNGLVGTETSQSVVPVLLRFSTGLQMTDVLLS